MKKNWPWLASLGVVLLVIAGVYCWMNRGIRDHSIREIELGAQTLKVEMVNTERSIVEGLSGRDKLPADGMLFIMPERDRYGFWMKEMKFDLDLVWINDGAIVEITPNVPHPENPQQQLEIYQSGQAVEMILEVGAGDSAKLGLAVGDKLTIK